MQSYSDFSRSKVRSKNTGSENKAQLLARLEASLRGIVAALRSQSFGRDGNH